MSSQEYLSIKKLSKHFDDGRHSIVKAVDHIDLTIRRGDFVTLLGPSGCGKTTTLRMIAGFEEPTSGEILLEGKRINNVPAFNRNMPMVFQSYALFPHLSIFDNIAYGLRVRKMNKEVIRNDVAMACQMVNLVGLENRYPGELSGGQQQRVALARALVMKPEIILFDEPLSNLDAKLRIQTRTEIKKVQQMLGITAIYVTHDQSEALSMSDVIVVMNKGEIVQVGTPEDIYNDPKDSFVADFIGNANFFGAIVEEADDSTVTVNLQGKSVIVQNTENIVFDEGEEVDLAIKPEAVDISDFSTGFTGILDMCSFLGSTSEYKLEFSGSFIHVIHSNTNRAITRRYKPGETVHITFNKDFFHIYKK